MTAVAIMDSCVKVCSRCGETDHHAAECKRKTFLRPTCTLCQRVGHQRDTCPQKRNEEYKERKAAREARDAEAVEVTAEYLERKPRREARVAEAAKEAAA